jgi:hypothetical protein
MPRATILGALAALTIIFAGILTPRPASALEAARSIPSMENPAIVEIAGEGSLLYNLAAGGACYRWLKNPTAGLWCGAGVSFADYIYRNRYNLLYLLAYSGGRIARVTGSVALAGCRRSPARSLPIRRPGQRLGGRRPAAPACRSWARHAPVLGLASPDHPRPPRRRIVPAPPSWQGARLTESRIVNSRRRKNPGTGGVRSPRPRNGTPLPPPQGPRPRSRLPPAPPDATPSPRRGDPWP